MGGMGTSSRAILMVGLGARWAASGLSEGGAQGDVFIPN